MEAEKKKIPTYIDRVSLTVAALKKLDTFKDIIQKNLPGCRISRAQLVNWIVTSQPDSLSDSQLKNIKIEFYDEVKFAEWAVKELKLAKLRGESLSFEKLIEFSIQKNQKKD